MAGLGWARGMAQLVRCPQHKREDWLQLPGENSGVEAHVSDPRAGAGGSGDAGDLAAI